MALGHKVEELVCAPPSQEEQQQFCGLVLKAWLQDRGLQKRFGLKTQYTGRGRGCGSGSVPVMDVLCCHGSQGP